MDREREWEREGVLLNTIEDRVVVKVYKLNKIMTEIVLNFMF